jgi:hypothetical protein
VALDGGLVPEFPVNKSALSEETEYNRSVKVDYAAFAADRSRCLFVELKTDQASRRTAQDEYLERSKDVGLGRILEGLVDIVRATSAHQKYYHLLEKLEEVGLLELPDGLADYVFPDATRGLRELQTDIEVTVDPHEFDIEVVYLQPRTTGETDHRVIDFAEMADWLEGRGALAETFAESLVRWRQEAGSREGVE